MRICLQRVLQASVEVDNKIVSKISKGILLFVGFANSDVDIDLKKCAQKILNLRIFSSTNSSFDKSLKDIEGEILIVSQFTLYGNITKGRRPDFTESMSYGEAEKLYNTFINTMIEEYIDKKIKTGIFGAKMLVNISNDGPVTIVSDFK
ncbi:MAG: D-aminoacyl-tRNA deacylase [Deferribacterota bacterium]|nr:D-aminoacyl-tRNA deacylase [Deferribacterota bacterium]